LLLLFVLAFAFPFFLCFFNHIDLSLLYSNLSRRETNVCINETYLALFILIFSIGSLKILRLKMILKIQSHNQISSFMCNKYPLKITIVFL
jgi:hypothetical protein